MERKYDVLIIGGGVVGSAIARELSRYDLVIGVLEKNADVVCETSGRNSGVIHAGFAYDPGTLKARFCVEANREFDTYAKELSFPFLRCGKLLVGNTQEDRASLEKTYAIAMQNGVTDMQWVDGRRIKALVPAAAGKFGLFSPSSGVVNPFLYTIALAENAHENGVRYYFEHAVAGIEREEDAYRVKTSQGEFETRWVVNSAGLGCGEISHMLGIHDYRLIGSKGQYLVLDKRVGHLLPMPVYPVPSTTYMGIHVTNSVDGNVLVGPNAELTEPVPEYATSAPVLEMLAHSASDLWPHIDPRDYIRQYSGILPKYVDQQGNVQDFRIEIRDDIAPRAVNLIGIESPGLTCAIPIARYVARMIAQREPLRENPHFNGTRREPPRFAGMSDAQKEERILENPDYGELICRCEQVTRAEVLHALRNPLGVRTLMGIKLRTRCMMGRCQGGYCQMRLNEIIEKETGKAAQYSGSSSTMTFGEVCP